MFYQKLYQKQLNDVAHYLPKEDSSILVTGATGLVGSFLVDTLLFANKYLCRKFAIYALGRSNERLKRRFLYASETDGLHFVEADISQQLDTNLQFDYIVHAASNADPKSYALYPAETLLTNILGTKSVLDYARKNRNTRVLLTSTFEVYGDAGKNGIITEESTGIIDFHLLRNCYPYSKVCAELLCQCYAEQYDIDVVIGRLCGVYGPTMLPNDSKAQAQFIRNAVRGENIVMKSKGLQVRSYCYVADAVAALLTVLLKGEMSEAYNISDEKSIVSIAEFARITAEVSHVNVIFDLPDEIEFKGFSKPVDVKMDNTKLKKIGWESSYRIKKGISECIKILRAIE